MRALILLAFIFNFNAAAVAAPAVVCEDILSTPYSAAINELALGYINLEDLRIRDLSSAAAVNKIEKELSQKRTELIAKIGDKKFNSLFKQALKNQNATTDITKSVRRARRQANMAEENKALQAWLVDKEIKSRHGWIIATDISPNGELLALGYYDSGDIGIIDIKTGQEILEIKGHKKMVDALGFSPDGKTIVSASYDGEVRITSVDDGRLIKHLEDHDEPMIQMSDVLFSPDGNFVLTASHDRTLRIWDAKSGEQIKKLISPGAMGFPHAVAFSPDGKTIAFASTDNNSVRLWDIESETIIKEFKGHESWVNTIAFSRDGSSLLTSVGNLVRLWDITSGTAEVFSRNDKTIFSAYFSPDEQMIVAGSEDNTAIVWDIKTKKEIAVLENHKDQLSFAGFTPDGQSIITAAFDDLTTIWKLQQASEND